MADHSSAEHAHDDHGGGHGLGKYFAVFFALVILTSASFFTYSDYWPWHDAPGVGWTFMMAVSCTKAMLVILFFMHVKYETNWKYVLTIPPGIMAVFLALALVPDIGLRSRIMSEERRAFMGSKAEQKALEGSHDDEHAGEDHHGEEGHGGASP